MSLIFIRYSVYLNYQHYILSNLFTYLQKQFKGASPAFRSFRNNDDKSDDNDIKIIGFAKEPEAKKTLLRTGKLRRYVKTKENAFMVNPKTVLYKQMNFPKKENKIKCFKNYKECIFLC